MFQLIILRWVEEALMAMGGSLIATGLVLIATPQSDPRLLALCLVLGILMMVGKLVLSLATALSNPKGE
ncbi:TPA: hypothetical protein ACGR4O_004884 [Pseudomonas aeruginosa]|jgi:hypothetical protein|uniref:Transmembrane protein n=1 Tax=Pseudomonas aeruginosa TaxID=287 RepID=A0A6C0L1E3_PSEAI|nr:MULTISPECIES: hypothetical protein [Pseudomonas aeruginosa group]EKU6310612.1 hypothetical protein [Pseudomonas aeruginosa]EKV3036692.1 hypothetical protein [Pseudomonas aeruginosa]EKV3075578.1 hypothetical protein [Pseudomonas aeruginosa]EKX0428534.1 hypothetical protein [Pseudomonas aeruginosa]EKX2972115.1 hypothetical protein [Pseudomonas aeruginosa]